MTNILFMVRVPRETADALFDKAQPGASEDVKERVRKKSAVYRDIVRGEAEKLLNEAATTYYRGNKQ